jgi:hypothetical protein
MIQDERIERAGLLYERAVFGGDVGALATEAADVARVSGAHGISRQVEETRARL